MKKILMASLVVVLAVSLPAGARSLFLQTQEQQADGSPRAAASVNYQVRSYPLSFAEAGSVSASIAGVLGEGEGVSVNEKLNTIFIRASELNQNRIAKLIERLDQPPLQVQVEAKIIELRKGSGDTTNPNTLGASWKYSNKAGADDFVQDRTTATPTSGAASIGLYAQLISGNVEGYLQALEKTTGYNLVASPWITAVNHEPAEILIGSKLGYKTTITTTTGTIQEVKFLEVGTKLKFIPHINQSGYVLMEVYPALSDGSIENELPKEETTETKNKVLVKDGQPIVIGGLTKNTDRQVVIGVPILSSIPLLGALFSRTEMQAEEREIIIVVTPHIVTPAFLEEAAAKAKELEARGEKWSDGAKLIR